MMEIYSERTLTSIEMFCLVCVFLPLEISASAIQSLKKQNLNYGYDYRYNKKDFKSNSNM